MSFVLVVAFRSAFDASIRLPEPGQDLRMCGEEEEMIFQVNLVEEIAASRYLLESFRTPKTHRMQIAALSCIHATGL